MGETHSMKKPQKRSRYVGVELLGHPVLPGGLSRYLALRLGPGEGQHVRVIRARGRNAIVEIPHQILPAARERWNEEGTVRTLHTWGTLRNAKAWLSKSDGESYLRAR